jgi:hypothetical protein
VGTGELVIHPEVELLPRNGSSFTEDVVQVFVDEKDIVHIAGVQPVPGG